MDRKTLLQRLKERKVVQWALIYLAGAWALLQFADFLGDAFDWQAWAMQASLVVAGFGFLAVLVLAWYHGERGHQHVTTTEILLLVGIAAAASAVTWQVAASAGAADVPAGTETAALPLRTTDADPRSIAVLPFMNIGGAEADEYFSDGITEDIIAQLARVDGLRVISRTSVMQYKGTEKTVRQIGAELGVAAILEGSVRRSGDRVRIVAQLIDVATDEHLWAETYDRGIQDVLKIQADVAQRIAAALQAELSPVQVAELSDREVDPEAYQLYLKGRELAKGDAPDVERAAEMFSEALRIDSTFAFAYSALTETLDPATFDMELSGDSIRITVPRVDSMVREAMARVPRAPEVQTYTARQQMHRWDFEGAAATARQAAEGNPNHAPARHAYGMVLARRGDYDGALRELEAARALDPHSALVLSDLGEVQFAAGRFDEAVAVLEATVARFPDDAEARLNLALAYRAKGQRARAIEELRRAVALSRENPMVLGHLGQMLAESGERDEARRILDRLMRSNRVPPTAIAQIHGGLGEHEQAARWLGRAARERSASLVAPRANRIFAEMNLDSTTARLMRLAPPPPRPPVRDTTRPPH